MLRQIDEAILARVEGFCHWFQRLTGLTNFWWTRANLVVFSLVPIWWFMDEMQIHPQSPNDAYGVAIVGLPMVMFISSIQLSIVAGLEEHYRESPSAAHFVTLNLRESVYFRVGVFSCSLFLIWVKVPGGIRLLLGLAVVSWLCLFASLYAIAVVPLPPGKSRISQWCDDIRAGFQKQVRMPAR